MEWCFSQFRRSFGEQELARRHLRDGMLVAAANTNVSAIPSSGSFKCWYSPMADFRNADQMYATKAE
ncbi:hypothetical protein GCM10007881_42890 [Mesorhizobium huakuii]|nr:hypothetical protein GCM10007881_42890 [Mesorhizobium huakuii]